MTEYPTLPARFLDAVDRYKCPRAQIHKVGADWEDISATEMLRRVARLSNALAAMGVGEGDRVVIFAANSPEWHVADMAVVGMGAVVVPIYFRESAERIEYIVNHAGAKVVFASGAQQVERLRSVREKLAGVERVVVHEDGERSRGESNGGESGGGKSGSGKSGARETLDGDTFSYGEIISASSGIASSSAAEEIADYRRRAAALRSSQLASIIYTSGTTGEPKGVMLSHSNFVSNEMGSFEHFSWNAQDVAMSFLPLAHVYERVTDYCFLFRGIPIAYVSRPEDVVQAMLEVRPSLVAAVPRFLEKLYGTVMERGSQATGVRKKLFDWAIDVERRAVPWKAYGKSVSLGTILQWSLADRLVYKKFRAGVGGRIRAFISGGAPLSRELAEFITTVGMPVLQGYGLTETSPVISFNAPNHIGTVGRPIREVEVRIADDGEILVRGPCVMMGYYEKPEETAAAISADGWFSTGDIGFLDADGYLTITDRKKELLKTAGGKLVAPAPIENALKSSPYILNAALVGDRRRFIGALIVINVPAVEARARAEGVSPEGGAGITENRWVHSLIEGEIARLTGNLAEYETIKRFALLERDFTFDGGELTYTLKLKRRVIEQHYADLIEGLYAEPSTARHGAE